MIVFIHSRRTMIDARSATWLAVAVLLNACRPGAPGAAAPFECARSSSLYVRDQLFLGRGIPSGGEVSDSAWRDFLQREVTPRFPGGVTVFEAAGQWQGQMGVIVQERSWVLVLYHPPSAALDLAVDAIAEAYRKGFSQEAVLRDRSTACVSF